MQGTNANYSDRTEAQGRPSSIPDIQHSNRTNETVMTLFDIFNELDKMDELFGGSNKDSGFFIIIQ